MKVFENFDSSKISWFRTGGVIRYYIIVESIEELKEVITKYNRNNNNNNKILVIGAGSNILVRDCGFNGVAVKLAGDFLHIMFNNEIKSSCENEVFITAGSGILSKTLSIFAMNNNLIGCEFLDTIPGTIGGNVVMNAGCFNKEIKDILYCANIFVDNDIKIYNNDDFNFSYRYSNIPKNGVILDATFRLKKGSMKDIEQSKNNILTMREHRKKNQILGATCGSTFINPDNNSAWKLIDEAGLRGYKIGGAKISEKHCNFIINTGKATATDVEQLIKFTQKRVFEVCGIKLKTEIKII